MRSCRRNLEKINGLQSLTPREYRTAFSKLTPCIPMSWLWSWLMLLQKFWENNVPKRAFWRILGAVSFAHLASTATTKSSKYYTKCYAVLEIITQLSWLQGLWKILLRFSYCHRQHSSPDDENLPKHGESIHVRSRRRCERSFTTLPHFTPGLLSIS